jgi:hypothetical protein
MRGSKGVMLDVDFVKKITISAMKNTNNVILINKRIMQPIGKSILTDIRLSPIYT